MFPINVAFFIGSVYYTVVIVSQITDQYQWTKLPIAPDSKPPFESDRGVNLSSTCSYAIAYENNFQIPNFDVTFKAINIQSGYLWTRFNWTGGNWTLYLGAQIAPC